MSEDLSLFGMLENEEVEQKVEEQSSMSEMIANRSSAMQKFAGETSSMIENSQLDEEVEQRAPRVYAKEEIFPQVVEYFGGDELAASVWIDKYALKNGDGQLIEQTPEDMHRRMAREFARIEKRYPNAMTEEQIFHLFDHFKYVIPRAAQWPASATRTRWSHCRTALSSATAGIPTHTAAS